jgi:hypothetical protein
MTRIVTAVVIAAPIEQVFAFCHHADELASLASRIQGGQRRGGPIRSGLESSSSRRFR